ncbi:hypothetical protein K7X08_020041 [Anisodus acutangulus]|uniref:Uncharacterized protein n=1 Tax=Anisodus acutangulus TaxID=402998 RepID=A0A9Q1MT25_9SOLA|nr:hypothetical protein K7X08_020041 [Anisodus acutangulus]
MGEEGWGWAPSPSGSPMYITKDDHWTHFDNSVNAVSFGFVATAILISMFLVMAILESFSEVHSSHTSIDLLLPEFSRPSRMDVVVSTKAREVSVLMPGEDVPTFIANPAPVPCPPERDPWPPHQQHSLPAFLNSDSNA